MRKLVYLLVTAVLAMTGCENAGPTDDPGTGIGDVVWATRNVESPGKFAESLASVGGTFNFDDAQKVCPKGWRIPTAEEYRMLIGSGGEWISLGNVQGVKYGEGSNAVFLPATLKDEVLTYYNEFVDYYQGNYWTGTSHYSEYCSLLFSNLSQFPYAGLGVLVYTTDYSSKKPVRCVRR